MKKSKPPTAKPIPPPTTPPTYTIKLSRLAQKQLDNLPDAAAERVVAKLLDLSTEPRPSGVKKLKG